MDFLPGIPPIIKNLERIYQLYGNRPVKISPSGRIYFPLSLREELYFECRRICSPKCCSLVVPIYPSDAERLASYFGISKKKVLVEFCRLNEEEKRFQLKQNPINHRCIFLRREGRIYSCMIHEAKPIACKLFPISGMHEDYVEITYCDGLGYGEGRLIASILANEEVEKFRREERFIQKIREGFGNEFSFRARKVLREFYLGNYHSKEL